MEQEQNAKHCGNPTPEGRLSFLFRRTDRQLRRCIEKKVNHTGLSESAPAFDALKSSSELFPDRNCA